MLVNEERLQEIEQRLEKYGPGEMGFSEMFRLIETVRALREGLLDYYEYCDYPNCGACNRAKVLLEETA